MNINFCSYFDRNYLTKFLACKESVTRFENNIVFYCLCLDTFTYEYLHNLKDKDLVLIKLDEIENEFLELKYAKQNRDLVEYFFTLSPFLPMYVLKKYKVDLINYVDSDLFFFRDPKYLIEKMSDNSIMMMEHGIENHKYGKYNVGWLSFKNNTESLKCLEEWSKQCVDWCYDQIENNKYADQKYLDSWPIKITKIKILKFNHSVAPWNSNNKNLSIVEDKIICDGEDIFFFHFHGTKIYSKFFTTGYSIYNKKLNHDLVEKIYFPYIGLIKKLDKKLSFKKEDLRNKKHKSSKFIQFFLRLKNYYKFLKIIYYQDLYRFR